MGRSKHSRAYLRQIRRIGPGHDPLSKARRAVRDADVQRSLLSFRMCQLLTFVICAPRQEVTNGSP